MTPADIRAAQRQRKAMRRYLAARKRAQRAQASEHPHRHVEVPLGAVQIAGRV